jgi:hypothetical protein
MDNDAEQNMYEQAAGEVSQALRQVKSASSNTWFLYLHQLFFAKTRYLNLQGIDLEFRLTMRPLNELISTTGTLGGSPVCTINSMKLLVKDTLLPESVLQNATAMIRRTPHHHSFGQIKSFSYSVPAGSTSISAVLTGITGTTSILAWVLRPTPIQCNNEQKFVAITDFNILDGNGSTLLGSEKLTHAQYHAAITPSWTKTSFFQDYPNVYMWSHALSPAEVVTEGSMGTGSHEYIGSEQLVLTLPANASALQLDVFALTTGVIEQTLSGLRALQL